MAARVRKGDTVVVIAGKDRGRSGSVLRVDRQTGRVLVEGINVVKRHQRERPGSEGGIIEREALIDVSNVMLADPKSEKPTRIRFGTDKDGNKVRVAVKSGAVLDG